MGEASKGLEGRGLGRRSPLADLAETKSWETNHMATDVDRRMALVRSISACLKVLEETEAYDDLPALMRELDAGMTDHPPPGH